MRKQSEKREPAGMPEFGVRAETIGRFFSPPLASSTFHDLVNKGKIVPLKGIRGFYKLNESLRRLGLREVAELPHEQSSRSNEDMIRLAFHAIDPQVFPAPSWLLKVNIIGSAELHHTELIVGQHAKNVAELASERHKHAYLQGALDATYLQ